MKTLKLEVATTAKDEKEEAKEDRTQATDDQCTGTLQYKADGYPTLHIECKDIDKLKEGEFLNDTILDFYLRYCINRHMLKTLHYMQSYASIILFSSATR